MVMTQVYSLVNDVVKEVLGETAIVQEDLKNIVDIGDAIFQAQSYDKFTGKLVDKVGKMVFVNRPYSGRYVDIYMDGWEWGAVLQKVSTVLPTAVTNPTYDLTNGTSYDPNVVNIPDVKVKFYSKYVTFEIDRTITERQLRSAFSGAEEMNAFVSMLFTEIENAFVIALDELAERAITNMMAETIYDDYASAALKTTSHTKAVNLLYLYNQQFPNDTISSYKNAIKDPDFCRYAALIMGLYSDRMEAMNKLLNIGDQARFTPKDRQVMYLNSEFAKGIDIYLQSGTFHNELTKIPGYKTMPYWQGIGTSFDTDDCTAINVKTSESSGQHDISVKGVLGCLFDKYACAVTNKERWVNTQYNAKADFTNYFYKTKAGFLNDQNEQFVVFVAAGTDD